jgi:hypothetical protein
MGERQRAFYKRNRAAENARSKKWRAENPSRAREINKQFKMENPDYLKDWHLRRKYGISLADRDGMIARQDGRCAACGCSSPGRKSRSGGLGDWIVDHCHTKRHVRAIICHPCNVVLGLVKDDPAKLRGLADYVERYT